MWEYSPAVTRLVPQQAFVKHIIYKEVGRGDETKENNINTH